MPRRHSCRGLTGDEKVTVFLAAPHHSPRLKLHPRAARVGDLRDAGHFHAAGRFGAADLGLVAHTRPGSSYFPEPHMSATCEMLVTFMLSEVLAPLIWALWPTYLAK